MDRSPDPPAPDSSAFASPARRAGTPREGSVPRIETVRVTAPDLRRRAAMEKTRSRLVFASLGFGLLFLAVIGKLAFATIIQPLPPHRPQRPIEALVEGPKANEQTTFERRATITDRNGEILAISLPTAALYANPREMIDARETASKLKQA